MGRMPSRLLRPGESSAGGGCYLSRCGCRRGRLRYWGGGGGRKSDDHKDTKAGGGSRQQAVGSRQSTGWGGQGRGEGARCPRDCRRDAGGTPGGENHRRACAATLPKGHGQGLPKPARGLRPGGRLR